jgi:hypothetical protein
MATFRPSGDPRILCDAHRFIARTIARGAAATGLFCVQHRGLRCGRLVQAAGGAMVTMSSAPRAAAMRSSTGMVGTAPPASSRERGGLGHAGPGGDLGLGQAQRAPAFPDRLEPVSVRST